ncbi:MAG: bifunctional diguanylate cyclase/phosphodiesterase, partial [Campylobacterota bacterium]|nr:bifunctional diguanylate cyclase/phosphodiesterase [Campylobacterota bacterium]
MKINIHSITFKTLSHLIIFSTIFIIFISFSAKYVFSEAYMNLEKDKISIITKNITPSIALNVSFGFTQAINEIANEALENENVLLLRIRSSQCDTDLLYTKHNQTIEEYIENDELVTITKLTDPITSKTIGDLTLVYSNDDYEKYMKTFYKLFFWGIFAFSISIIVLAYLLFKSLKNLTHLAYYLKNFNPKEPEKFELSTSLNDEVSSITISANIMIDNLIKYLNYSNELTNKLSQNQIHLKDAQRIANVGSWEYDVSNNILILSDEIYRIYGIKKNTTLNWEIFNSLITKEYHEYVNSVFDNAIKNGSIFDIKYEITINNKIINIHTRGKVRKKVNGSVKVTAVSMDISEETRNKKIIDKLAYYDALTELPNRSLLKDRTLKALQNASRNTNNKVALIFLDLDHFKLINDTLGHGTGDKLLVYVSKLLQEQVRESDTVARIGGDEFIVLLPNIKSTIDVENIAKKILKAFQGQHDIDKHQLYITTSIGASIYPDNSLNMDELITNADTAMYDAKQDGRNRFKIYAKSMGNYISTQMSIEQDLKNAINNKTELEIYYQVKINTNTNLISGAEALIRWNHPTKGLIFPDDFINIAESTGIILEMGDWIIEQTISQINEWNKLGFAGLKIAINLSPRQFQNSDLVPFIHRMMKKYNLNPAQLEFEITETMSMSNMDATMRVLDELKDIGVSIAIDDFGTGYSSLSYLKKFPVNTLKIDKSFVMDMIEDEGDRIIVQTIISMAHSLGFTTVAEGVETLEHVKLLKNMDCNELQGYHFSKAIPKDEFTQFLQNYSSK